jgi:hypothetical protein
MMITIIIQNMGFGAFLWEGDGLETCVRFIDSSTIHMGNLSFVLFFIAFIETFLSKAFVDLRRDGFFGRAYFGLAGGQEQQLRSI